MNPATVTLHLRDIDARTPPEIRLRRALKALLRNYGWRCVAVSASKRFDASTTDETAEGGITPENANGEDSEVSEVTEALEVF